MACGKNDAKGSMPGSSETLAKGGRCGHGRTGGERRFLSITDKNRAVHGCLTHIPIWEYDSIVPRAATHSDVFNAVAEPRRRDILEYLAPDERAVGEIADAMDMAPPVVPCQGTRRAPLIIGSVATRRIRAYHAVS